MISKIDPVTPARHGPVIFLHSTGQGRTALPADFLLPPRDEASADHEMYVKYRRPLLQTILHRRIPRAAAEDLLQRTFLQAIKKIRTEGLDDAANLGGYLYRTACNLATVYWRGELSRRHDSDHELLSNLKDEALPVEERLDHEQLAVCVRDLIGHLPVQRDREVLKRYYLAEESRTTIRESLQLTDKQFNQVIWRARQRLAAILRKRGFAAGKASKAAIGCVRR